MVRARDSPRISAFAERVVSVIYARAVVWKSLGDMNLVGNILSELRFTVIGAVLGVGLALTAALTNIDIVKINLAFLESIERHRADDILTGLTSVLVGLAIDRVLSRQRRRKRQQDEIEAQRLRTLRATMRTVHDIVNNFLNNLMLFEIPAQDDAPHRSLNTIEELIQHTSQELRALGDVESVVEQSLAIGIGIEYPHKALVLSR